MDPLYGPHNITCMNFVRSKLAAACSGHNEEVEPLNRVSSYIDASQTYGSTEAEALSLRTFRNGQKRQSKKEPRPRTDEVKILEGGDSLQAATGGECAAAALELCFKSGDPRVNENPALAVYHTLWHREHNRSLACIVLSGHLLTNN